MVKIISEQNCTCHITWQTQTIQQDHLQQLKLIVIPPVLLGDLDDSLYSLPFFHPALPLSFISFSFFHSLRDSSTFSLPLLSIFLFPFFLCSNFPFTTLIPFSSLLFIPISVFLYFSLSLSIVPTLFVPCFSGFPSSCCCVLHSLTLSIIPNPTLLPHLILNSIYMVTPH